jgi:hypothetical protein
MTDTVAKAVLRSGQVGPVLAGTPGEFLQFGPDGRTVQGASAPPGASKNPAMWWGASGITPGNYLIPFDGGVTPDSPNPAVGGILAPYDCTLRNLLVATTTGVTSGGDVSFTIEVDGVPSAIVATIPGGGSSGTDDVHSLAILRGQKVRLVEATTGASAAGVLGTIELAAA